MEIDKIYVVIVSYNGMQWYERCFNSLRLSLVAIQTIVIDNASSDDTLNYIRNNYPEINLIESDVNMGFGQANNIGIKYALQNDADYVFLLNQDAWIESNSILGLVNIHKANPEFGILSPIHINSVKNKIEKGLLEYIANFRITSTEFINDLYFNQLLGVYETLYVNAAAWLLPKRTIEVVGGFDPLFFHYGEDDNYMHRVKFHSFKIGLCPKYRIVHDTERIYTYSKMSHPSDFKTLLVDFTNINLKINFSKRTLYFFRKAILKFIIINIISGKYHFSIFMYLIKMKKAIIASRKQNMKRDNSWL